ncbi:alpha/beta hydrolase [Thermomonospora amylolytica]|uniref:alpha/beta hydrolase n=1 Tax=Thermomonospora amylolytica TaxID=1411117 RepID=UPI001F2945F3|nr:alpha/beta hydrolase [Thermomonospora amylolytica]
MEPLIRAGRPRRAVAHPDEQGVEADALADRKPSVQSAVISRALRYGLRPFMHRLPGHPMSIRTARTAVDAAAILIGQHPQTRLEHVAIPREGDRPLGGELLVPEEDPARDAAVLYLHGGGYIVCSPRTHRPITSRLSADCGLPVFVPHYRLAPEHPFPAPLEDALDAYCWLLEEGYPADRIVIAGDSAGGHLAAALTGEICRSDLPDPAGMVLFSPWVDLTCELAAECDPQVRDAYISPQMARRIARLVTGRDELDPRLALLECDWQDVPPVLIQVGGDEVLRPEAERLAEALTEAGVDCVLQIWPGQIHDFQIFNRVLPEARQAMEETARFISSVLDARRDAVA